MSLPGPGGRGKPGRREVNRLPGHQSADRSPQLSAQERHTRFADLVAAARNSWLVCFDKSEPLPKSGGCRLPIGDRRRFRWKSYTATMKRQVRCHQAAGIQRHSLDLGAARPDFLDRALIVEVQGIRPDVRRDESCLWREFNEAQPRILGGLLDALAAGLRRLPEVKLDQLPRMADFAAWVTACEESLRLAPCSVPRGV